MILSNSIEKGIYESMESLIALLGAYDDTIASLALEALCSLATPPIFHRCHMDWVNHRTCFHKQAKYSTPIFAIIESAHNSCKRSSDFYSWESITDVMKPDFSFSDDANIVSIDSQFTDDVNITNSNRVTSIFTNTEVFHVSESVHDIINITTNSSSLFDILNNTDTRITSMKKDSRFLLMWRIRMQRWKLVHETKANYFTVYYEAILILLCCYDDAFQLATFFQDKLDVLQDFLSLLRMGPGSDEYNENIVPIRIRLLACHCLQASMGSEDSLDAAIFGRFQALQHSLGLNRGQYMGLLPCLLRSSTAYLLQLSTPSPLGMQISSIDLNTKSHEDRLLWIESIFLMTMAVLQNAETNQYISENGLLSSLLAILKASPSPNRSNLMAFLDSAVITTAETTIALGTNTCTAFLRQGGLSVVLDRLEQEINILDLQETTITSIEHSAYKPTWNWNWNTLGRKFEKFDHDNVQHSSLDCKFEQGCNVIQNLLDIINTIAERGFVQDNTSSSHGGVQVYNIAQIFKSPQFIRCLRVIYSNPQLLNAQLLRSIDTIISELINADPATPSMISHFVQSGIAELVLSSFSSNGGSVIFTETFIIDHVNLIYSLALTRDGLELVMKHNPYNKLMSVFLESQYCCIGSKTLTSNVVRELGSVLEETIRHYPQLSKLIIDSVLDAVNAMITRAEEMPIFTSSSSEFSPTYVPNFSFHTNCDCETVEYLPNT